MRHNTFSRLCVFATLLSFATHAPAADPKPKPYRLPSVSIKQPIIWDASATSPDGYTLTFGGQDQTSDDGINHTRLTLNGNVVVTIADLRKANPFQAAHDHAIELRNDLKKNLARARSIYLQDNAQSDAHAAALIKTNLQFLPIELAALRNEISPVNHADPTDPRMVDCLDSIIHTDKQCQVLVQNDFNKLTPEIIAQLSMTVSQFDQTIEILDCEPPPRALSPILYHPGRKQFILFGGDHLDYLTNDLWAFDLAKKQWQRLDLPDAPPPRANHTLRLNEDGTIAVAGGYEYANNTDYMGGQYLDRKDNQWTCDLAQNKWISPNNPNPETTDPNSRLYRTGPFSPDYFLEGDKPDRAAFAKFLAELPPNTWTKTNPPQRPQLNRDWGTAVIAPDRDLILRFSGGHCAHGGSDVLHYHMATNRWELPFPVEFPLGQLYDNTEYPEGFNFNHRPWVTGHTYQNYAYDQVSELLLFTGRKSHVYAYDPTAADWLPTRTEKPKPMIYSGSFYDLTCCATPNGVYCWTHDGALLLSTAKPQSWTQLKLTGEKLKPSSVDNSTLVHDTKRNRLLFWRKEYGDKHPYDGTMQSVDLTTLAVSTITPENAAAGTVIPYLCQIRYDPTNDLFLAGCTLPPDATNQRRTPAYDPSSNRWISLKIAGDDPSGKAGRNVSLGMMYDAARKLFWATDTNSQVYVLRLDPKTADAQPMQ